MHRRPTAETFDEPLSSFSPIPPLPTSILLRVLFVDSLRQVEIQVRKLKCDRTDNDQLLTDSNTDFESVPQLLEDFLEMVDWVFTLHPIARRIMGMYVQWNSLEIERFGYGIVANYWFEVMNSLYRNVNVKIHYRVILLISADRIVIFLSISNSKNSFKMKIGGRDN